MIRNLKNKKIENEADLFLMEEWSHDNSDDKITISADSDAARQVVNVVHFMKDVARSEDRLFVIRSGDIVSSALGLRLVSLLRFPESEVRRAYPIGELNPLVRAFFSCTSDWVSAYSEKYHTNVDSRVDALNQLVMLLKGKVSSAEINKQQNKWARRSAKNYNSLLLAINSCFERHSRICALRIDLGYRICDFSSGLKITQSFERVHDDRVALIDSVQKLFGDSFLFFAWKLEYGLLKGFHYHLLLFLKGSDHSHDILLSREIGEMWGRVTHQQGTYFNCSIDKTKYKEIGIGLLSAENGNHRKGLENVAKYLTKPDYYIALEISGNRRTFGKSVVKKSEKNKPGPKRRLATRSLIS